MTASRPRRRRLPAVAATVALGLLAASGAPVAAVASAPERSVVVMTPQLQNRIEERLRAFFTEEALVGFSAAVVTSDPTGVSPVITTFSFGVPEVGSSTAVDASTQFELGSETKAFTADLLASLVASGAVSLDDPVQQYAPEGITVPDWTDPQTDEVTQITLRDLATHQAGLPDIATNFEEGCGTVPNCQNPHPGYTQTMLWEGISQQALLWRPGTDWLYSNWGFGLLGTILSNVVAPVAETDPPAYQSAISGAFLDALGMGSTVLETRTPNLAAPYLASGAPAYYWDNTNAISGAGGLISNTADMGTWVAAHLGYLPADAPVGVRSMVDTLQPVSDITTMCTSATECENADFRMGLAWQLYSAEHRNVGVDWAFKNGGTAGSRTDTVLAPSLGVGVTTMFNKAVEGDELATSILAMLVAERRAASTGGGDGPAPAEPTRPSLAESGIAASALTVAGVVAVALLGIGGALRIGGRRRA